MPEEPRRHAEPRERAGRPRNEVERCSKELFGNLDFLDVAVAIARSDDGVVNATDLSRQLGVGNPRVRAQLISLANVGLLMAAPRSSGKQYYIRQEGLFWDACVELYETRSK